MKRLILRFAMNESGATAIEYGLIVAGISIGIFATVSTMGSTLADTFAFIDTQLKANN
jgi:pilus assembly protein Flp/PilA